jgi:FdhD protein
MRAEDEPTRAVHSLRVIRISTDGAAVGRVEETVGVVVEAPITIEVEGVGSYTVLCTPADLRALALGFLLTENIIQSMADVDVLRPCRTDPGVLRVTLTRRPRMVENGERSLLIVSSCGACGSEDLEDRLSALPRVGDSLQIDGQLLRSVSGALREHQVLFDACGGTHAAAIFDRDGEILSCAEDAGRHSALDKAIGKCLLLDVSTAGCGVMLSGRVSMEMVGKCARAGIELIAAVSAPTTLAIDVAERCNVTLCDFVRETRATIFTYPGRIFGR